MVIWLTPSPLNCPRGLWMTPWRKASIFLCETNQDDKALKATCVQDVQQLQAERKGIVYK